MSHVQFASLPMPNSLEVYGDSTKIGVTKQRAFLRVCWLPPLSSGSFCKLADCASLLCLDQLCLKRGAYVFLLPLIIHFL